MKNIYQEIELWAQELPYWEQLALDKIMAGELLDDNDYEELLDFLLAENDLLGDSVDRKPVRFDKDYSKEGSKKKIILNEMSNLKNVNALVEEQRLTFSNSLTAIFGGNGSGKSGYARMIGSGGFTRGDQEVLPDVTEPYDDSEPIRATFEFEIDENIETIDYAVGDHIPELSSFYVFDSTSVQVHMSGKNTFSFSPAGLSILTELSEVTDGVRDLLNEKVEKKQEDKYFEKYFSGESEIKSFVSEISPDTDIEKLEDLEEVSTEEEKRLHKLGIEIGNIGLGKHKDDLQQKIQSFRKLKTWVSKTEKYFGAEKINESNQKIDEYVKLQKNLKIIGVQNFQHEKLSQTGTDEWENFIHSAHKLAKMESKEETRYPQNDDICLLCHQTLSDEAKNLIIQLWDFVESEVQEKIDKLEKHFSDEITKIKKDEEFSLDDEISDQVETLDKVDTDLAKNIRETINRYRDFGESYLESISRFEKIEQKEFKFDEQDLHDLDEIIKDHEEELENPGLEDKLQKLEEEQRFLEHKKRLSEVLLEIKKYIFDLNWAEKASKVGGSTHHITSKYNDLFTERVKDEYIEVFTDTLENLGRSFNVEISTMGKKGETLKQIQLKAHKSAESFATPEKVLSEGEKRAIALADFLTEAKLDVTSNGIILDDPVTSLDLAWRKEIAHVLAKEANDRQVIIFTHDLPFLYHLINYVDDKDINKDIHWIKRGDEDDRPGYVYLNNCPALEKEYKSSHRARQFYKIAKDSEGEEQVKAIRDGMGALRTSYEALVVFEVFGGVVLRFEERISIGRLTSLVWDDEILEEIEEAYGRLSRYIEGHLHTDAMYEELTPDILIEEIEKFDALKNRIKDLKKERI